MRSLSLVAILLAFVALVPLASAQTMTVSISGAPAAFTELQSNATASISFNVDVVMSGVVCQGGSIPITITAMPSSPPPFFSVLAEPSEISINVPANAYPGDPTGMSPVPGPSFSGSAQGTLVATTTEITANASVPVQISATAGAPSGCTPTPSAASSEAVTVYANMTAPPPPPPPTPEPEEKSFLPGPGAAIGTLAALAAVALRRGARRQD